MNRHFYFFSIAGIVFAVDQLTKFLAMHFLRSFFPIRVIKGFLYLSLVNNKGAAFGILSGQRLLLIAFALFVSAVVVYFHSKLPEDKILLNTSLALLLGGSVGNMFDRIFRASVVDFIDFRFWPAFNVADSAVNIGLAVIIFCIIFRKEIA